MPNAQDLAFVQLATASGLAEFTEGQIAISKSLNPAVRDFGQQMVTDHTAAGNQLSAIAADKYPCLLGLSRLSYRHAPTPQRSGIHSNLSRHASGRSHSDLEAVPTGN